MHTGSSASSNPHGLAATHSIDGAPVFLPLKSVTVLAKVVDVSAHVELVQVYKNTSKLKNATAQYIFPVPANAAVCGFQMSNADGRTIRAVVKELDAAREEYEDAVANDQWAGLLQQLTGDVFCLSVGAIPPKQDITVSITYVQELAQDEFVNQVRFYLPTYVAERYGDPPAALKAASSTSRGAKLDIRVDVQMTSQIEKVFSPSHRNDIQHTQASCTTSVSSVYTCSVTFKPNAGIRRLDRDFVLSIQAAGLDKPRCVAEVDHRRNSVAMSLSLVPNFGAKELSAQEYVFVIDRSGSMGMDSRIVQAKEALQILLKSLPSENTSFNIVGFGNSYTVLWDTSRVYNQWTLKTATDHVDGIGADMGGTEIGGALRYVFAHRKTNVPTSVIVLTDGEVWDINSVLQTVQLAVSQSSPTTGGNYLRVFTLGIGDGASTALCEGIARAGNGVYYLTTQSEQIAKRCANLLQAAKSPPIASLYNIAIDWGYNEVVDLLTATADKGKERQRGHMPSSSSGSMLASDIDLPGLKPVQQAPSTIPELFLENRYTISAILSGTTSVPQNVFIKGRIPSGIEFTIPISVHEANSTTILHSLAARRLITELEDGNITCTGLSDRGDESARLAIVKAAVERFSVEYQLASSYAAFVVVEDESGGSSDITDENDVVHTPFDAPDTTVGVDATPAPPEYEYNAAVHKDVIDSNAPKAGGSGPQHSAQTAANNCDNSASVKGGNGHTNPDDDPTQLVISTATALQAHTAQSQMHAKLKSTPDVEAIDPRHMSANSNVRRLNQAVDTDATVIPMPGAWHAGTQPNEKNGVGNACAQQSSRGTPSWIHRTRKLYKVMMSVATRAAQFWAYCNIESVGQVAAHAGMACTMRSESMRPRVKAPVSPVQLDAPEPLYYEAPTPIVRVVRKSAAEPQQARVVVTSGMNPVAPVARLQSFDGSFSLDRDLTRMLTQNSAGMTLQTLKDNIPSSIEGSDQAETVWGTVLAIAHLRSNMPQEKDVWSGLLHKAMKYVMQATGIDSSSFAQLVDEAYACLLGPPRKPEPEPPILASYTSDNRVPGIIYLSTD